MVLGERRRGEVVSPDDETAVGRSAPGRRHRWSERFETVAGLAFGVVTIAGLVWVIGQLAEDAPHSVDVAGAIAAVALALMVLSIGLAWVTRLAMPEPAVPTRRWRMRGPKEYGEAFFGAWGLLLGLKLVFDWLDAAGWLTTTRQVAAIVVLPSLAALWVVARYREDRREGARALVPAALGALALAAALVYLATELPSSG